MRFRMLDTVDRLDPWTFASGRKAVSLEEYSLHDPLGRGGAIPESLVLAAAAELCRWLAIGSSDFRESAVLDGLEGFSFFRPVGMGDVLALEGRVLEKREGSFRVRCLGSCRGREAVRGTLNFLITPLAGQWAPEAAREAWMELHGRS